MTLNKLEYSFQNETMPPVKYYTVHWGSVINNKEKEIVLNWIEQYRAEHHYNGLATAEFAILIFLSRYSSVKRGFIVPAA